MPIFDIELEDGRTVTLESEQEPTEDDVFKALGSAQPQATQPESRPLPIPESLRTPEREAAWQQLEQQKREVRQKSVADNYVSRALGAAEQLVGGFARLPSEIYNQPARAANLVAGRPVIREVAPGQSVLPEMLKSPEEMAKEISPVTQSAIGRLIFKPEAAQQIAGGLKGAEDLVRGIATPEVLMTAPAGLVGGVVARAPAAAFAGQMVLGTPEAYSEFGRLSAEGTPAEAARAGVGALGSSAAIGHLATAPLKGAPNASKIANATGVPESEVRARLGQDPSLRQQGEAPGAQEAMQPLPAEKPSGGAKEAVTPEVTKFIEAWRNPNGKVSNASNDPTVITTKDTGLAVKSVADLEALLEINNESRAFLRDLKRRREAGETITPEDQQKFYSMASGRVQFPREVIEYATNTGSWRERPGDLKVDRPLDWQKNPEVADWLKKNAQDLTIELPEELKGKVEMSPAVASEHEGRLKRYFHGTREKLEGALRPGLGRDKKRFLHEEGICC